MRSWALAWATLCGEETGDEAHLGIGGVLLETADWQGGLRDRVLVPDEDQKRLVDPTVEATIEAVKANVFPIHGLK